MVFLSGPLVFKNGPSPASFCVFSSFHKIKNLLPAGRQTQYLSALPPYQGSRPFGPLVCFALPINIYWYQVVLGSYRSLLLVHPEACQQPLQLYRQSRRSWGCLRCSPPPRTPWCPCTTPQAAGWSSVLSCMKKSTVLAHVWVVQMLIINVRVLRIIYVVSA